MNAPTSKNEQAKMPVKLSFFDLEGSDKVVEDINNDSYVAIVGSFDDVGSMTVFVENVSKEESKTYTVPDFIENVLENCDDINPKNREGFVEVNNEFKPSVLRKLLPQKDGSLFVDCSGYIEEDPHWTAKNKHSGVNAMIIIAKKGGVDKEWLEKNAQEIKSCLVSGERDIMSVAKEDNEYRKNPSAYHGVSDSDFSSMSTSSIKVKRF